VSYIFYQYICPEKLLSFIFSSSSGSGVLLLGDARFSNNADKITTEEKIDNIIIKMKNKAHITSSRPIYPARR